jgi:hypothetical protein
VTISNSKRVEVTGVDSLFSLTDEVRDLLEPSLVLIKESLLRSIRDDFDNKSNGGVGLAGVTWSEKVYGNRRRGIGEGRERPSGTMRDSLDGVVRGTGVSIFFSDRESYFFDLRWPLIPTDADVFEDNVASVISDAVDNL